MSHKMVIQGLALSPMQAILCIKNHSRLSVQDGLRSTFAAAAFA